MQRDEKSTSMSPETENGKDGRTSTITTKGPKVDKSISPPPYNRSHYASNDKGFLNSEIKVEPGSKRVWCLAALSNEHGGQPTDLSQQ
ncbi:hypothetical protein E2C01_044260 [Portunus trituberculatus]|uniref:Uncharacterized protein n=1 Tax=Portunus trituberculatus TaxID=210409 RepID=A0A5B7FZH8_PORTR|nr:hypothetical protein [Portunus trituberculatus]